MRGLLLAALLAATPALAAPTGDAPSEQLPLSVWRLTAEGPEHLQSGFRCPPRIGDLERAGVTTYDGFGLDVSCGWNSKRSVITVYLTRGVALDKAYESAKAALMSHNEARAPRLIAERQVSMGGLDWRRADYRLDAASESAIWMADLHGWILEYRATYPEDAAQAVEDQLRAVTDLVLATAGARLDLCGRAEPPERAGREVKPTRAAAGDTAAGPGPAPTFCVEKAWSGEGLNLLFWRGVAADGSDARVDRLTPMTMDAPPALESRLDETGTQVGRERWAATITQGAQTSIFAYYEGRPSAETLRPLLVGILRGKARPIGGYSVDGKAVSAETPPR